MEKSIYLISFCSSPEDLTEHCTIIFIWLRHSILVSYEFIRLSADVLSIFIIFPSIVFSENRVGYSICVFDIFPKLSAFCLHLGLIAAIFLSFSKDNNCKFSNISPKTITGKMLFFWRHLRKVKFILSASTVSEGRASILFWTGTDSPVREDSSILSWTL